jgi:3-isopropylmalate/(R)-2-methylmalate dehydratase small subunit
MKPFTTLTSIAAPLPLDNVETDVLIPARMCVRPAGADYGDALFYPWRYLLDGSENPEFVLNQGAYRRAQILVTGANFGFGSSREHAVYAARDFGLRAILATSFAAIFAGNCVRDGILPAVVAPADQAAILEDIAGEPTGLTIELERQLVSSPRNTWPFTISPLDRTLLLEGLDATTLVLRQEDKIAAFRRVDESRRPWIYEPLARS